ncbi:MAG: DUF3619 family protein [Rhodanobacter sp.]|nr:MAG: DUF3619 family protein [Rhodanobacter sp.]TAM08191.1 MAG: DUF3619 family protein [Rhodanobacter sp.]TAM36053.1 MAG: DUF3619 family protein [Rhodanobacter sp.]
MKTSDETFARQARTLYHTAAQRLDPALAARLRTARREALAGTARPARRVARWLVPSGACAAIALAAVLSWPTMPLTDAGVAGSTASANQTTEADNLLPPDPEQADPNLYQNLDFYGWLAANARQPAH